MTIYLNELAPWERKKEYIHNIQMGKDISLINGTIRKQRKEQLSSVNSIIASQDRIREGLYNINGSLNNLMGITEKGFFDLNNGLQGLQEVFEWGLSEIVWQLEQNRKILADILNVLMSPLDNQAKELKYRAEKAFANGWYEDALEDFLESERKNKYDFSIHISIGMIYLFHIIDKNKALLSFEKAIKYSLPQSKYYASYSLLYKGLIMKDLDKIHEAVNCTEEAIKLSPDFAEAHYQNAQHNSELKNIDKCLHSLRKTLFININYSTKAFNDPVFNPIKEEVNSLFQSIRNEKKDWVNEKYKQLNRLFKDYNDMVDELAPYSNLLNKLEWISQGEYYNLSNKINSYKNSIARIEILLERNSLIDLAEVTKNHVDDLNTTIASNIEKVKPMSEQLNRLKTSLNSLYLTEKTFIDNKTKLEWHRDPICENTSFRQVFNKLERMNATKYAGYSDWRLPTKDELSNLLESDWRDSSVDKVHEPTCMFKGRPYHHIFSIYNICMLPRFSQPRETYGMAGFGFNSIYYVTQKDYEERVSFLGLFVKEHHEGCYKNKQFLLPVRDRKESVDGLKGGWSYFRDKGSEV